MIESWPRLLPSLNIDALDFAVRQAHEQIVLPVGVVIVLVPNLDARALLRLRRPIFGPMKIERRLSQNCNHFLHSSCRA